MLYLVQARGGLKIHTAKSVYLKIKEPVDRSKGGVHDNLGQGIGQATQGVLSGLLTLL